MTERKRIWLDCDPGHDDALALILAMNHPELELLGVSTVHGNQTVAKTTINALKVLWLNGFKDKVKVWKGAVRPLCRVSRVCPEIHGESGLDTGNDDDAMGAASWPKDFDYGSAEDELAVVGMARIIGECPDKSVRMIATGSMTNVALFIIQYPELAAAKLDGITFLGGSIGLGNITPSAEFNILIDPEACNVVFTWAKEHLKDRAQPLVMVPLEVSHTALVTPEIEGKVAALGTPSSQLIGALLSFFRTTYKDVFDMPEPPLHDPCAVLHVVHPELFTTIQCNVTVDTSHGPSAGATHVDVYGMEKDEPAFATVATAMDVGAFWSHMLDSISVLSSNSPHN